MVDLLNAPGVDRVAGGQRQYGAGGVRGTQRGSPIPKPTGSMSNSPKATQWLARRCEGQVGLCSRPAGGKHVSCSGPVAKDAQKYSRGPCRAIIKGVADKLQHDSLLKGGCYGIQVSEGEGDIAKSPRGPAQANSDKRLDDLTGQVLKDSLVQEARSQELPCFHAKGV